MRARWWERLWDDGRSPYEPDNPFVNLNMIWIAGLVPFAGFGLVAIIVLAANIFGAAG